MGTIFTIIVSTVAGGLGWWIGEFFGFAFALVLSTVASVFGWYYGMKWNREYFS